MMFRRRAEVFCPGQLVSQVGRFMDQHWKTLRANVDFIALVFNGQQWLFLFRGTTIQASIDFHCFSNRFEITKALVIIERLV
jgi:hypothetical protein